MRCRAERNCNSNGAWIDIYTIRTYGHAKGGKLYLASVHEDDLDHKMINEILNDGGVAEFDCFINIIEIKDGGG